MWEEWRGWAWLKSGWAAAEAESLACPITMLFVLGVPRMYLHFPVLISGWALCSYASKVDGRMRKKGMVTDSSVSPGTWYLTKLFFSSPTEKEATKFFSSRNGCGQVLVVIALWWMKKKKFKCDCLNLGGVMLRFCMGRELSSKELHFRCTEVSLYSKIMLFLKQVAKCKYHWVGICLFLKKHLRNYRAI